MVKPFVYLIHTVFILIVINTSLAFGKNKQVITVGVYDNPPKIFIDKNNKPAGVFIDIVEFIALNENYEIKYEYADWDQLVQMLNKNQIDVLPDMAYTVERDTIFKFNKIPVLESWLEVFTNTEVDIKSIRDIAGKKIGVLKASVQEKYFQEYVKPAFEIDFEIISYNSYNEKVKAVRNNEINIIIADRFFYFSDMPDDLLHSTSIILRPTNLYFAFNLVTGSELSEIWDKNISMLKNNPDSEYYKSLSKWLEKPVVKKTPEYIKWIMIIGGILIIVILAFNLMLRYQVRKKTKEIKNAGEKLRVFNTELIESKKLFQTLSHISPVGIFRTDKKGKTTYVNPRYCELSGLSNEEALDHKWLKALHPDDKDRALKNWSINLTKGKESVEEFRFIHPDKSIKWVQGSAVPEIINNEIVGYIGTITDITAVKESEAQLIELNEKLIKAKEIAEKSDKLKTQFLANMSHEIRTPMNGILGFLELMKDENISEKETQDYINIVEKSTLRLLDTINDIIEISKIEAGQIQLHNTKVNVTDLLNFAYDFFIKKSNEMNVKIVLDNRLPYSDLMVTADENKLQSILTNLLGNAIKFTKKGNIVFGSYIKDDKIFFFVNDTGIGIPESKLSDIFKRFVQASEEVTNPHEGAGLGLAIVKAYLLAMGGDITVKSKENEGSSFVFYLPFFPTA